MDGGIRRGSDIVKALCLGARAVLIGRAYAYGVAAGGGPGVARAIEILRADVVRTLKLLGCASTAGPDPLGLCTVALAGGMDSSADSTLEPEPTVGLEPGRHDDQ